MIKGWAEPTLLSFNPCQAMGRISIWAKMEMLPVNHSLHTSPQAWVEPRFFWVEVPFDIETR